MSGVIGLWQSDDCRWPAERFSYGPVPYVKLVVFKRNSVLRKWELFGFGFGFETALGKAKAKAKVDNWERR